MKKILLVFVLALVNFSTQAMADPVEQLKQAYLQAQKKGNSFSGYYTTCVGAVLFSKSGPLASNRQCLSGLAPKSFIEQFVTEKGLQYVYRNQYMDLVSIPNGTIVTAPKGNFYYLVNYDTAGNASEITVMNDALP